eukprot:2311301-Pleurochrysis_carterae.AAC.2
MSTSRVHPAVGVLNGRLYAVGGTDRRDGGGDAVATEVAEVVVRVEVVAVALAATGCAGGRVGTFGRLWS